MMRFAILVAVLFVCTVNETDAHGHLAVPLSRVELAFQAGLDYCPHCVLWDVVDGLEPYQNRPYPGG